MVHSLANGPEVKKPLIDTSRAGYLAAVSISAYSNVSMVRAFGPMMRPGGSFLSLTYMAGERVIPGYGGGMSSAKAALESDTRTLAYEAGRRHGVRVNTISAGPFGSRAATAIGFIGMMIEYCRRNAPLPRTLEASEVGATAAFLASPLAGAITGTTIYVDNGYHSMGMAVDPAPAEDRGLMRRFLAASGAISGGLAVVAGAFGAHALRGRLEPDLLVVFETGARYQMYHALALFAAAWLGREMAPQSRRPGRGGSSSPGTVLFSGSLYLLALTGIRALGAITPLGGVAFSRAGSALALGALRLPADE